MTTSRIPMLLAVLGLGAFASAAIGADTVGPVLPAPSTTNLCSGGLECTYIAGTEADPAYAVPGDGVVTSWQLQSGSSGGPVTLRVLRPENGTLRAVGASGTESSVSGTATFTTRLAVMKGDVLGITNTSSALLFGPVGSPTTVFGPGIANGQLVPAKLTLAGQSTVVPLIRATVEADADGDGFGDETQDRCLGDRTRQVTPCRPDFSLGALVRPARVTRMAARRPVVVSAALSRSSSLRVTVSALRPGRRVGTVCAPREIQLSGRSCQASVLVRQATRTVAAGTARIPVNLAGLAAGRYTVKVEATDREGSDVTRTRAAIVQIRM